MKTKIFFDLDGTLINSTKRLYLLFQYLVPDSRFGYDEYWKLKRNMQSHAVILGNYFSYDDVQKKSFQENWMKAIETNDWLQHDQPFSGVTEYLHSLQLTHELYIITARQFPGVAVEQIEKFGWNGLFKRILVPSQAEEKETTIQSFTTTTSGDWIVGDTGKDIEAGKKLGMKTAAVLSGFRNRYILEKYNPDLITNFVTDLSF